MAGENGPTRPYIAAKPPLPADVRNCNFYVLMEAMYRRNRSCVSALTPVSVFRVQI